MTVKIDNENGLGQVPMNQDVAYHGFATKMKPSRFLSLARHMGSPRPGTIEHITQHIKSGGAIGAPFLQVTVPDHWASGPPKDDDVPSVRGHEGRHRMTAVKNVHGDLPIETHMFVRTESGMKMGRKLTPEHKAHIHKALKSEDGYVTHKNNLSESKAIRKVVKIVNEAFDHSYPFSKYSQSPHSHEYFFNNDRGHGMTVEVHHEDPADRGTEGHAQVAFYLNKKEHSWDKYQATGQEKTRSTKVFGTMKKILQQHAKEHPHITHFGFTSNHEDGMSRTRAYSHMVKKAKGTSSDEGGYAKHLIPTANIREQTLHEIFDNPYDYKHTHFDYKGLGSDSIYEFKTPHGHYKAVISRSARDTHWRKKGHAHVTFEDDHGNMNVTGGAKNHAHRVFSTMKAIIKHHAKKYPDVTHYNFTGSEGSRNRLYSTMAKKAGGETKQTASNYGEYSVPAKAVREQTEQNTALLKEIFDSAYPYKKTKSVQDWHMYSFDTEHGNKIHVHFNHDEEREGRSSVSFESESPSRPEGTMYATGEEKTRSPKVFSTVKRIMKDHATKHNIREYEFTADKNEPSRVKLYNKLTSKVSGKSKDTGFEQEYKIKADKLK